MIYGVTRRGVAALCIASIVVRSMLARCAAMAAVFHARPQQSAQGSAAMAVQTVKHVRAYVVRGH